MNWTTRIYALLLRLYPSEFREDFGDEMTTVFARVLSDAQERGWLSQILWLGKEYAGLIIVLMRERWLGLRREQPAFTSVPPGELAHEDRVGKVQTPVEIIAGILPFMLFGLMFTIMGLDYHWQSSLMRHHVSAYLLTLALLLIGLGIGWAQRFPRWSYAYLGAVLVTSSWLAGVATVGFRLFGYTFGREQWGWRAWVPLLVLTIVMLLITRSPRPLVRLIQDIRQDWTRLSFALYAALTWLMLLISYDSKTWYNQTAYLPLNLFLFSLLFTVGAFLYMWRRRPWPRVLALKATLILYFLVIVLVPTLDGRSVFGSNSTVIARFSYFLFLLMWTSVPLAPGLAQKAWHRLRPI